MNLPEEGDRILLVPIGEEVLMIPKGAMPEEGDHIAVFELPDGSLITTGKSVAEVNDGAIIYPNPFQENENVTDVIAITGMRGIDYCPLIGYATPRNGAYTLSKKVIVPQIEGLSQYRRIVNSVEETRLNVWFKVWGNLRIEIGGEVVYEIMGANGEEYAIGSEVSFLVPEDGILVELIFSGDGVNGMTADIKGVRSSAVYACVTEL